MINLFEKAFKLTLLEKDGLELPADPENISDADAMASTLDAGTEPSDYDIEAGTQQASIAAAKANAAMIEKLHVWISKIEEFTIFLNGQNPESIQSQLSKAHEKSLFGSIKTAETKKIALVARELAGFKEMLNGYVASSSDPKYKGV